jgi:hypothetical protein
MYGIADLSEPTVTLVLPLTTHCVTLSLSFPICKLNIIAQNSWECEFLYVKVLYQFDNAKRMDITFLLKNWEHRQFFFFDSLPASDRIHPYEYTGSTGAWTQGFILARQVLFQLSHTFSHFCSGYFLDRVLLFAPAVLDHNSPIASGS